MLQMYSDCVLKVVAQTRTKYIGFDVLTEQPVEKLKIDTFISVGEAVMNLIKSEVCRTRLVYSINPDLEAGCDMLGVQRTAYIRMRKAILVPKEEKRHVKPKHEKTQSKITKNCKI